ncbi:MAG: helix-turn-helix domain-containing protein [Gemmatimonadaceae bacterium]
MPLQPDDPIPALKRQLAQEIRALLGDTNQHVAARRLGVDQPRMSDLLHDKLDRFSLEKLIRLLRSVDRRVELRVINEGPARLLLIRFPPRSPPR